MFEDAARDIAAKVRALRDADFEDGLKGLLDNTAADFAKVATLDDLLSALAGLDKLTVAQITNVLALYDLDKPIKDQRSRINRLYRLARLPSAAYERAIAEPGVMISVAPRLGSLNGAISIHSQLNRQTADPRELGFLQAVCDFVMLSLVIGATASPAGQALLSQLQNARASAEIFLKKCPGPASFIAETSPGAYCTAGPHIGDVDPRQRYGQVKPGAGAATSFGAPIWLDEGADLSGLDTFFADVSKADALGRIFTGSVSFGRGAYPFYTPPRIEVLHEMVHVLHNARGENRANLRMPLGETQLWTNPEEYWAIDGGTAFTENAQNAQFAFSGFSAPVRYGHSAAMLHMLSPDDPDARCTMRQLSMQP